MDGKSMSNCFLPLPLKPQCSVVFACDRIQRPTAERRRETAHSQEPVIWGGGQPQAGGLGSGGEGAGGGNTVPTPGLTVFVLFFTKVNFS